MRSYFRKRCRGRLGCVTHFEPLPSLPLAQPNYLCWMRSARLHLTPAATIHETSWLFALTRLEPDAISFRKHRETAACKSWGSITAVFAGLCAFSCRFNRLKHTWWLNRATKYLSQQTICSSSRMFHTAFH
jgi:hypothetical protein